MESSSNDHLSDQPAAGAPLVPLAGSERETVEERPALSAAALPADAPITATVVVRRRAPLAAETVTAGTSDPEEYAATYGADPADLDRVAAALAPYDISVETADQASRSAADRRHRRCDGPGVRHHAVARHPAGSRRRHGHPPPAQRTAADPGRARRHRHRGARSRRPAPGRDPVPAGPSGGRQHDDVHPARSRQDLPLPGRHRRIRADDRDPRTRRRFRPVRPRHLLRRPRHHRSDRDGRRCRRRHQRAGQGPGGRRRRGAARHRSGRSAGSRRSHRRLLRAQHRRRIPRRAEPGRARDATAGSRQHQLGPERGGLDRSGQDRVRRGAGRRRGARGHRDRRRRRRRQHRPGHRFAFARGLSGVQPARHWPAAAPGSKPTSPPARSGPRPCGTKAPGAAPPAVG